MRTLNLGCGPYKIKGAINIDRKPRHQPDLVRDVTRGLPFDDSSVYHVNASHFLEHLSRDDMMFVIEECYRVLIAGGQFTIRVPVLDFSSLDHLQILDAKSFDTLALPETADYYQRTFKWKIVKKDIRPDQRAGHNNLDIVLE